jgi:small-conductance mechanosensitive channel
VAFSMDALPVWGPLAGSLAIGALLSVVVRALVRRWLNDIAEARPSEVTRALAAALPRPVGAAAFLVSAATGLRLAPLSEPRLLVAHRFLAVAFAVLGVAISMRVGRRAVDAYGRSNPDLGATAGVGKAVIWLIGLGIDAVLISDAFGISLAPALTALGVGSLAVALALQDTLSNFFSGLYLVVDKPVRPGDFVRIDPSYEGYVEAIGWRSTRLRTLGSSLVIIPNAALSKAIITNFTLPTPHVATSVRVDVTVDADVERVEAALEDEARRSLEIPGMVDAPAPSVALSPGFVDGALAFSVSFYSRTYAEQGAVQHALRMRIAARLKKEGIPLSSVRVGVLKSQA